MQLLTEPRVCYLFVSALFCFQRKMDHTQNSGQWLLTKASGQYAKQALVPAEG